jgi:hypothetical protein
MSITQSSIIGKPELPLDQLIECTEEAIKKQAATIKRLTSENHEVTDAAKQLTEMIVNLAALMQKRRNGG